MSNRKQLNKEQKIDLDDRILELRSQGLSHRAIAKEIGYSQPTVQRTLVRLADRAMKNQDERIRREKFEQIAVLAYIAEESLDAWRKSKQPRKIASRKESNPTLSTGQGQGVARSGKLDVMQRTEERWGETRYLAEARAAMADIRKILGADAPIKTEEVGGWKSLIEKAFTDGDPGTEEQAAS